MPISIRAGTNSQEISTDSTPMVETMGSLDITPDSPHAFSLWYHNREKSVGIPGSLPWWKLHAHFSLYVQEDASGYSLPVGWFLLDQNN